MTGRDEKVVALRPRQKRTRVHHRMRFGTTLVAVSLLAGTLASLSFTAPASAAGSVTLTPIAIGFPSPNGIGYYAPSNSLVLSVNYPKGKPNNFDIVNSVGTFTPFGTISGLTNEVYIAAIQNSACQNGFTTGDLYFGTGVPGVIAKLSSNGTVLTNPWVTLPGETGLIRGGLYQDLACVAGGDLIVTTNAGDVWRVTASGTATEVASGFGGKFLEGPVTVPVDPARYGPWSGQILAADESNGVVWSIDPTTGKTGRSDIQGGLKIGHAEGVMVVPPNENFFGVDFGARTLLAAPASQFTGVVGDVVVATEQSGKLWDVVWNGTAFVEQDLLTKDAGQWEGTTFAAAGLPGINATTSITTSLSGGGKTGATISVPPSTAVTDAATLSGANSATATGTVTYNVYSDSACSVSAGSGGTVNVTAGSVPASSAVTLSAPGTYYWQASYSGDTSNAASTSTCGSEIETVTGLPTPSVTTAVQSGGQTVTSVPLGSSVSDQATVSGTAGTPTGTVTFTFFSNGTCTAPGTPDGTGTLSGGVATSAAEVPTATGSYSFMASYGGSSAYSSASGTCEMFTVTSSTVKTSLSETPSATTVTSGTPVTFTYDESNTGTAPITNVTVTGSSCGQATLITSSDGNTKTLDPGATWTFTCTETLSNTNSSTITVTDVATATGTANGTAAPPETAQAKVKVKPAPPCGLAVAVSPNPLVETGQSEVHGVVQVEACPGFAGDAVNIASSQLSASSATVTYEDLQGGTPSDPHMSSNDIQAILDDDGNATVVVDGFDCAPGQSVFDASMTVAPFLTALTTLKAEAPVVTASGVAGSPNPEVETGDTSSSGDSSVYAVFYVETDPVYAEQTVEISSPQLEAGCIRGWRWEPGNGGTAISGTGVNAGPRATTILDNDGNAVFVFKGSSSAAQTAVVTADVLAGTHTTYVTTYTVLPPQVTPS